MVARNGDHQGQLKYRGCCEASGKGLPETEETRLVRPLHLACPSSGCTYDPTSALREEVVGPTHSYSGCPFHI